MPEGDANQGNAPPGDSAGDSPPFRGFDVPEQNWFRMPNNWTDITAGMKSLAELKLVEYVLRHSWGYQEYGIAKRISTDEFMHGRRRQDGTRIEQRHRAEPAIRD